MTDYEEKYFRLLKVYRDEVVEADAKKKSLLVQLQHQLVANAKMHNELEDALARETYLVDNYLASTPVGV